MVTGRCKFFFFFLGGGGGARKFYLLFTPCLPPPPPNFLHKHCFLFLMGFTMMYKFLLREIENNAYAKILGG